MTDLPEIIRLAEAATPGPWFTDRKKEIGPRSDADDQSHGMIVACADAYSDEDAAFIAAANPATVKAMAERLMRYEKALNTIAAYDDQNANEWLKLKGHYGGFDEPGAVQTAREALESKPCPT